MTAPPPPPPRPQPTPREAAIAGILGLDPETDSAGLLGVDPERTDDGEIVAALNERLARVNAHRYGGTPLGDEARLALHAAAAQLLGNRRRGGGFAIGEDSQADLPARWDRPKQLPPAHLALQQDAVLALGAHGGWNATTMRHLSMLAHARGLTGDDLAVALSRLARQNGPVFTSSTNGAGGGDDGVTDPGRFTPADAGPSHAESNDLALLGAMAVAVVLTLMAAAAVLIAIPVMRTTGQAAQQAAQAEAQAAAPTTEGLSPEGPTAEQRARAVAKAERQAEAERTETAATPDTRIDTIVTDLRLAAERRRKGEASAQRVFERAVVTLANNWPRVPPDQRQAALGLVIDHLYLVRDDDLATRRVVAFLAGPLSDNGEPTLAARVWQVGAIVRLNKEQDLPTAAVEGLRGFLLSEAPLEARAVGDFSAGVTVSLRAELAALVGAEGFNADPDAWAAWLEAVEGLFASEPQLGQRLLLAGLEAILMRGPEPTDERVFQIVRRLVVVLPWRPEDESRSRLLAWFDDPAVTIADLHAVTNVLATASGAPGVDPTMVLPVLASSAQRSQVRDRFAAAWNVQSAIAHGEVTNRWLSEARRHLETQPENAQVAHAVDAAVSARLNTAAELLWQGLANEADVVLLQLRDGLDSQAIQATAGTRSIYMASHSDPSPWALRYLEQRRPELQADLLDELMRSGPRHAVDAEIVTLAYLRGSTATVREKASAILSGHASKPVVIAAVLEAFPLPGGEVRRRQLVEMVTGVRLPAGDSWELVARRTLVERLLQLLAAEGELARIDRAADAIAQAYTRSLSIASTTSAQADNPPELSAELMWNRARQRADRVVPPAIWPLSPGEVDRRLAGRTRLAQGRVQWFAAYQSALVEIALYNAAAERPSLAMRLSDVLTTLQEDRRDARGVLQQVSIVERARLEAWRLKLADAASGGTQ